MNKDKLFKIAWDYIHADKVLSDESRNEFIGRNNSTKSAWISAVIEALQPHLTPSTPSDSDLRAENERLRKALRFYGNGSHISADAHLVFNDEAAFVGVERGQIAKEALRSTGSGEKL